MADARVEFGNADILPGVAFGTQAPPARGVGPGGVALGGQTIIQPTGDQTLTPTFLSVPLMPEGIDEVWHEIKRGFELTMKRSERDAVRNVVRANDDEAGRTLAGEPRFSLQTSPEVRQMFSSEDRFLRAVGAISKADSLRPLLDEKDQEIRELVGQPADSLVGGAFRDVSRFMAWFLPMNLVMKAFKIGAATRAVFAGAGAEVLAYDPTEVRLSNMLVDLSKEYPAISNLLQEQLAADPTDGEGEARRKQMLEGALLAIIPDAAVGGGKSAAAGIGWLWRQVKGQQTTRTAKQEAAAIGNPNSLGGMTFGPTLPIQQAADFRAAEMMNEVAAKEIAKGDRLTTEAGTAALRVEQLTGEYRQRLITELQLPDADVAAKTTQFKVLLEANLLPQKIGSTGQDFLNKLDQGWNEMQNPESPGFWNKLFASGRTELLDRSGNLKREFSKLGPAGETAKMMFDLTAGASPRAGMVFDSARKSIYGGKLSVDELGNFTEVPQDVLTGYLDQADRKWLDEIIATRSVSQILTRHPDFNPGIEGMTVLDAQQSLKLLHDQLGPEKFAILNRRATIYFDEMRRMVDYLDENGLLEVGEAEALKRWDYSPTKFINTIDPLDPIATQRFGKSVSSSGIEVLGGGADKALLTDSEKFLAEIIGRTYSRVFKNRASAAVYDLANQVPDNGFVTTSKKEGTQAGWVQQEALIEGKKVQFWMDPKYYNEYAPEPYTHSTLASLLAMNGLVKPFATGINPEFIITNFPRDLQHLWLSTSTYSRVLPIAMGEMAVDLASIWSDVIKRGPKFQEYMEQGGGMNLLTHQGQLRSTSALPETIKGREASARVGEAFHALGYFNETSELLTRMMHRERLIKQGMDPVQATYEARNRLDFAQGGKTTKALEAVFPYINAAVQGYRGIGREAAKNPVAFAAKTAQLAGIFGNLYLSQAAMAGYKAVPAHVKAQNIVIMLPGVQEYDDQGPRHGYITIPIDHSVVGLKAGIDAMMEKMQTGENPSPEQIKAVASSIGGIVPGSTMPASVNAMFALWGNQNWWQNREVWPGDPATPFVERYQINPDRPTSPVAVDVGRMVERAGLGSTPLASPMQLEAAFGALVPQNVWTDLAGWGWAAATGAVDDRTKADTTAEMIAQTPGLRRVLKFTQPFTEYAEAIHAAEGEAAGVTWSQNRELNFLIDRFNDGKTNQSRVEVLRFIDQQPQASRVGLMESFQRAEVIDNAYKRAGLPAGIAGPPPAWWNSLAALPIDPKVKVFVDEFAEAWVDPEFKDQRVSVMRTLVNSAPGFQGTEFRQALGREMSARGFSYRF